MTSANKQPRWDLYESAILLEAVQNVEAGIESKNDAIKRVSSMLRRMATNRGLIIDDTFRNVNGITFQFQSMEYSAYGRLGTTHKTGSKVFDEIVALFCNNNAEYLDILHIAYSQIGVTSQEITHNQLNDSKKVMIIKITSETGSLTKEKQKKNPIGLSHHSAAYRIMQ